MTYNLRGQLPERVVVPDVQVSYLDTCGTCNICDFSGYDKCPVRKEALLQEREVKRSVSKRKSNFYWAK